MIASYCLHTAGPIAPGSEDANYEENCERQLATAEREMGAFVMAVGRLFGSVEAFHAADRWIEIAGPQREPVARWIDELAAYHHCSRQRTCEGTILGSETRVVKGDEQ